MRVRTVAIGALATLFAACGAAAVEETTSGCVSAGSVPAAVSPEAANGRVAVAIAARDDRFAPECVEAAAGELLLVVRNEGRHPHNLTIATGASVAVDGGQVALLAVSVGSEGLRYVCTIHPGMEGHIRVVG